MRWVAGCAALLLWLAGASTSAGAADEAPPTRHLYAQQRASLVAHLTEVATRNRVNLIYPHAGADTETAVGLEGWYDLAAALNQLLQPRDLDWRRMPDGSIRIDPTAPRLRVQVGTVDIRNEARLNVRALTGTQSAPQDPGTPDLLAQRTAAGWSFTESSLRVLPATDLGRWLSRSPNAYGQGSRLSLRGIERDGFVAQTSSVRLHGLPLSAAALDARLPLPSNLTQIDFALGPQPDRLGTPGFAGELNLDVAAPLPLARGSLRLSGGERDERRLDLQQNLDLRSGGTAALQWLARERAGSVRHAGKHQTANDTVAALHWLLEPQAMPALTLFADLLRIDARPADERISRPIGVSEFDPSLRADAAAGRRLALDERGARVGARWLGEHWTLTSTHTLTDSTEHIDGTVAGNTTARILSTEKSRGHQLLAIRELPIVPLTLRLGLDQIQREAQFFNTDELPLSALFPTSGTFIPSAGSTRKLTTGVEQRIRTLGGQLWLQAKWRRLALEAGTGWAVQDRAERSLVQRTVSANCTLTSRIGEVRDCRSEVPEFDRRQEQRIEDPQHTPAITLLYAAERAGRFGLQWRRGTRSGGARPGSGQTTGFSPERSDSFELSWRSPDHLKWSTRLAVFRNFWRDRQVQLLDPGQPGFAIVNAGRAQSRGGELTLSRPFTEDWSLAIGIGVLHTRFDRFQLARFDAPADLAGNRFPGAPARTATLSLTRSPQRGLEFGALLHAADAAEGDAFNSPAARLGGRAELDLRLGWRGQGWSTGLELLNALDHVSVERIQLSLAGDVPRSYELGAPRQLRASLQWQW